MPRGWPRLCRPRYSKGFLLKEREREKKRIVPCEQIVQPVVCESTEQLVFYFAAEYNIKQQWAHTHTVCLLSIYSLSIVYLRVGVPY